MLAKIQSRKVIWHQMARRPESFLVYLGDHDFVLTSGISSWTQEYLKKVALSDYGLTKADLDSSKFYNLRNYVYSQASDMHLYQILVDQGYDAFRQTVLDIVIPRLIRSYPPSQRL